LLAVRPLPIEVEVVVSVAVDVAVDPLLPPLPHPVVRARIPTAKKVPNVRMSSPS
jgi:hypothetical protein